MGGWGGGGGRRESLGSWKPQEKRDLKKGWWGGEYLCCAFYGKLSQDEALHRSTGFVAI